MNPFRAMVPVDIDGARVVLRYDWEAIAQVQTELGDEFDLQQLQTLERFAELGFARLNPEITGEYLRNISPPVLPLLKACQEAYSLAYFGSTGPPAEEAGPSKKKLRQLYERLCSWAAGRVSPYGT